MLTKKIFIWFRQKAYDRRDEDKQTNVPFSPFSMSSLIIITQNINNTFGCSHIGRFFLVILGV